MRNFQLIASGLGVTPLLNAIARQNYLWNANDMRQTFPGSPHAEVDDIWLRFQGVAELAEATSDEEKNAALANISNTHESICYPAWFQLPETHQIIFDLMHMMHATRLGRVLITRLAPGKQIAPHRDGGSHAEYYDRYHLALQCLPGALFKAGLEQVQMKAGELWWFNNAEEHEIINHSADDRVVMIIDIQCVR